MIFEGQDKPGQHKTKRQQGKTRVRHLGAVLGHLAPSRVPLGCLLVPLGAVLGRLGVYWNLLGTVLGRLGLSWDLSGAS